MAQCQQGMKLRVFKSDRGVLHYVPQHRPGAAKVGLGDLLGCELYHIHRPE